MSTDTKIVGGIAVLTVVILIGGVFFLSRGSGSSIPKDQVVTQTGLHWHPKLSIYIKGEKQEIPSNVGIGTIHEPIHTHDDAKDGVLHMEMKGVVSKEDTKLGNFFRIWGKELNSSKLFDKINGSEGTVKMTVNGQESKDFENYLMKDKDSIEIRYE